MVFFMLVSMRFHACKITLNLCWWLNGHISESKLVPVMNCQHLTFVSAGLSANVQMIVCVKGNHTGYAESVIHEHRPKTLRNGVSIASCRRLKP